MTTKNNQIEEEGIVREGKIIDSDEEIIEEDGEGEEGKEKDTQSSKGDNKDGTKKEDEDDLPFHKHPRWVQKQQELEELKQQITDLEEITRKSTKEDEDTKNPTPIPQEFIDLFGDDRAVWDKWQKLSALQRAEIKKEVTENFKNESKQQADAIENGKKYVEDSLKGLEDTGAKFDRNELIKFMIDFEEQYSPILNKDGNYDFAKGLELMQKMNAGSSDTTKNQDIQAKKKIGSIEKKSGGKGDEVKSIPMRELRNKSFGSLASED